MKDWTLPFYTQDQGTDAFSHHSISPVLQTLQDDRQRQEIKGTDIRKQEIKPYPKSVLENIRLWDMNAEKPIHYLYPKNETVDTKLENITIYSNSLQMRYMLV